MYGGTGGAGSYAARSAAAHAAHSSSMGASSAYNSGGTASTYSSGAAAGSVPSSSNPTSAPAAAAASSSGPSRSSHHQHPHHQESPAELAHQSRLLTDATRRVQEHTYYMNKAMNEDDGLPTVLEHAAMMLSELGDPHSHHSRHHHHHHHQIAAGQPGHHVINASSHGAASHLSPKSYYELHMRILNEMPNLEEYFTTLSNAAVHSYSLQELYESVQYCPKVVPRLYLQICAGSALINSKTVSCKTVLNDLIEAVKCVQCPIRGLFLRSYLMQATKEKLPDVPDPHDQDHHSNNQQEQQKQNQHDQKEQHQDVVVDVLQQTQTQQQQQPSNTKQAETPTPPDNGTVTDAHQFVLKNFIEMNKLWVRVQHTTTPSSSTASSSRNDYAGTSAGGGGGNKSNREARRRRERERNELRILVGTNLVRLSQLECVTTNMYATSILPAILNQITSCRDPLAQAYLMDCIIQVFPDEFHIDTLQMFLDVCPKLRDKVNVRTIVQSIMERLSNYYADEMILLEEESEKEQSASASSSSAAAAQEAAAQKKENSFQLLNGCIQNIVVSRKSTMPNKEIVRLQMALLKFTLKCYPGNIEHVNQCLASCANSLRQRQLEEAQATAGGAGGANTQLNHMATTPNLDDTTVDELEKLLSIPLDSLALKVLQINHYSDLLTFLPWDNRRQVAVVMLKAVETSASNLTDLDQIEELFVILTPLILEKGMVDTYTHGTFITQQALEEEEDEKEEQKAQEELMANTASAAEHDKRTADLMGALGISSSTSTSSSSTGTGGSSTTKKGLPKTARLPKVTRPQPPPGGGGIMSSDFITEEQNLVAKLLHLLRHDEDTDVHYKMLVLAKQHLCRGGVTGRLKFTLPPIVFESLKLLKKVRRMEMATAAASSSSSSSSSATVPVGKDDMKEEKEEDKTEDESKNEEKEEKTEEEEAKDGDEAEEDKEKEKGEDATEEKEKVDDEATDEKEKEPVPQVEQPPAFNKKTNCRKIFVFIQKTIAMLSLTDPEASFKLNLEAAIAADRCAVLSAASSTDQKDNSTTAADYSAISYEFMAQAFQLYEDEISESKAQQRSIELVVGTLLTCKTFEKDDYEALITKTAQYAAKLLKKPDQCRMVTLCSHLFFTGVDANDKHAYRNPQRVLECLQRALKIADACSMASSANVQLFVEILEHYVYYFEKDNPVISDKFVSGLVALIKEHMESIGFSSSADQMVFAETQGHYRQILRYLQKKKEESDSAKKFANVVC